MLHKIKYNKKKEEKTFEELGKEIKKQEFKKLIEDSKLNENERTYVIKKFEEQGVKLEDDKDFFEEEEEYNGHAITLGNIQHVVFSFVLVGMVLGAGVIALTSFESTTQANVTQSTTNILINQLPTVGTMIGVGLIILTVLGTLMFMIPTRRNL